MVGSKAGRRLAGDCSVVISTEGVATRQLVGDLGDGEAVALDASAELRDTRGSSR